jgi:hypothetical protein
VIYRAPVVSADDEARHLIALYKGDEKAIMSTLHSQLAILANRSQTLLSLAGLTITVTGFSGANIARSGRLGASLLVGGLVLVVLAAVVALFGILRIEWITRTPPIDLYAAVRLGLERRNAKTVAYERAMALLVAGLTLYVSSISVLLIHNMPR